ncbi:dopamine receptor 4-like isoform X2 [Actinia tenebrosa]|nr:dopamine receptor 4-like isoform X2 [Actinia tenebrosa]XP_031549562.1 dopamine receptor 4-like isoform X2 [Actinia tenebrosa]XP_031549563.1 dopamine receptor 4-like isoform X2 [Actinia tenebrosa]XP_031549564.1 dopamine receptor 4-like isoform X2 [Actinia tenebrosa]XP_031549565.1 dopamine receptor 4-like isoform X2 [Actinia tenebrosa]
MSCVNSSSCSSCPPVVVDSKMVLSLLGLSVISVFTIFGNTLVCMAFATNKRLRILTNFYVASLAISDVLVAVVNIPLWTYWRAINFCNFRGNPLYETYVIFDILCGTASIWNMAAISIDRLLAVVHPTVYRARLNKKPKLAAYIIIYVWTFSTAMALLRFTWKKWNYALFLVVLSFFIPLFIILFSYGKIYSVVRYRAKWTGSVLIELRLARTLAIVIGAFVLCWGPFFMFNIVAYYCRRNCKYGNATEIIKWFQYTSSCINPIIYTIRNKEFRYTFHKLIFRCDYRNGSYRINSLRPRRTICCGCCSIPDFEIYETRSRCGTFTEDHDSQITMATLNGNGHLRTLSFTNSAMQRSHEETDGLPRASSL